MKHILLVCSLLFVCSWFLWAQRGRFVEPPPFEVKQVLPKEIAPGKYEQVDMQQLQQLADDGWELVSVTPWIMMNEEHGDPTVTPRPVVTQAYHVYFFKRLKMATGR